MDLIISYAYDRDGPIRKFHYSAEAEYLMNATATEAEASAEYFLPFFTNILLIFTNFCRITLRHKVRHVTCYSVAIIA